MNDEIRTRKMQRKVGYGDACSIGYRRGRLGITVNYFGLFRLLFAAANRKRRQCKKQKISIHNRGLFFKDTQRLQFGCQFNIENPRGHVIGNTVLILGVDVAHPGVGDGVLVVKEVKDLKTN